MATGADGDSLGISGQGVRAHPDVGFRMYGGGLGPEARDVGAEVAGHEVVAHHEGPLVFGPAEVAGKQPGRVARGAGAAGGEGAVDGV